jgi:hypothetical protein
VKKHSDAAAPIKAMYMLVLGVNWNGIVYTLVEAGTDTKAYDGAPFAGAVQVTLARLLTVKYTG